MPSSGEGGSAGGQQRVVRKGLGKAEIDCLALVVHAHGRERAALMATLC
jgi:hypothetical protein